MPAVSYRAGCMSKVSSIKGWIIAVGGKWPGAYKGLPYEPFNDDSATATAGLTGLAVMATQSCRGNNRAVAAIIAG